MQYLFQVNAAPGSEPAAAALVAARQLTADGAALAAVFFYFDGVRHAHGDDPQGGNWSAWAQRHDIPLLLCRTAWQRRYQELPASAFRLGSLTDLVLWLERVDAVRCFGGGAA